LYIQLYLGGFGLELGDIEALSTVGSKTAGHPEFRHTKGVEITTGPLGQVGDGSPDTSSHRAMSVCAGHARTF